MAMKSLEEMSMSELWELFPIVLAPHDDIWEQWAVDEISFLQNILRDRCERIHHIGSTAINGIWAKPIIDILLEVDEKEVLADIKSMLIENGYICMSESKDRMSFNKGYTPDGYSERVFHLHLRRNGDIDEIYFRDYLNQHHDIAKEYEALKLSLWEKYKHNRDAYTNAKSGFVQIYTQRAKLEFKQKN